MPLINEILHEQPAGVQTVPVTADRHTLSKRRWRSEAADGTDFAVDLERPCGHGDVLWVTSEAAYVVKQLSEPVIEIPLPSSPMDAARLGWFLGNQHLPVELGDTFLRLEAGQHLADLLRRQGIAYRTTDAVFSPAAHSAGHAHHQHSHIH